MNPLSALYGTLACARRSRYARHPHLRRRLHRPVISVGNLVVGGSGKTPVVAAIARLLKDAGERPVILSRGYARRERTDGPLVASDAMRLLEGVERSGDEPQMLARALPGVPVIVGADRYASGLVAEERLQATVILLDDAFQHLQLARDVDLLIMSAADLNEALLPAGRLREPLSAARAAHALIVRGSDDDVRRLSAAAGIETVFRLDVAYDAPRLVSPYGGDARGASLSGSSRRAIALAGIARPQRFYSALREQGVEIVREYTFRDHYWFTPADVERITASLRELRAEAVITTEKDAVRLEPLLPPQAPWVYLPMRASIEPGAAFRSWLAARLAAARAAAERHA